MVNLESGASTETEVPTDEGWVTDLSSLTVQNGDHIFQEHNIANPDFTRPILRGKATDRRRRPANNDKWTDKNIFMDHSKPKPTAEEGKALDQKDRLKYDRKNLNFLAKEWNYQANADDEKDRLDIRYPTTRELVKGLQAE